MKSTTYSLLILLGLIAFSSCKINHYSRSYSTPKSIDLRSGKRYLINEIFTTEFRQSYFDFHKGYLSTIGGPVFDFIIDARSKGVIVSPDLAFDLSEEDRSLLNMSGVYDYLMHIEIRKGAVVNGVCSSASAELRIYDLDTGAIHYQQFIRGSSNNSQSTDKKWWENLASGESSPEFLSYTALKKILKDMRRHSK